jgi:hypothetical protein
MKPYESAQALWTPVPASYPRKFIRRLLTDARQVLSALLPEQAKYVSLKRDVAFLTLLIKAYDGESTLPAVFNFEIVNLVPDMLKFIYPHNN